MITIGYNNDILTKDIIVNGQNGKVYNKVKIISVNYFSDQYLQSLYETINLNFTTSALTITRGKTYYTTTYSNSSQYANNSSALIKIHTVYGF